MKNKPIQFLSTFRPLTDEEKTIIIQTINTYSEGGHPVATNDSLPYFSYQFVINCLLKRQNAYNKANKVDTFVADIIKLISELD